MSLGLSPFQTSPLFALCGLGGGSLLLHGRGRDGCRGPVRVLSISSPSNRSPGTGGGFLALLTPPADSNAGGESVVAAICDSGMTGSAVRDAEEKGGFGDTTSLMGVPQDSLSSMETRLVRFLAKAERQWAEERKRKKKEQQEAKEREERRRKEEKNRMEQEQRGKRSQDDQTQQGAEAPKVKKEETRASSTNQPPPLQPPLMTPGPSQQLTALMPPPAPLDSSVQARAAAGHPGVPPETGGAPVDIDFPIPPPQPQTPAPAPPVPAGVPSAQTGGAAAEEPPGGETVTSDDEDEGFGVLWE